jgi:hypothetical protein
VQDSLPVRFPKEEGGTDMWRKGIVLLMVMVLFISVFAGCGASNKSSESSPKSDMPMVQETQSNGANLDVAFDREIGGTSAAEGEKSPAAPAEKPKVEVASTAKGSSSITNSGYEVQTTFNAILSQRKIIRNANIILEVDDFEAAYIGMKTLIEPYGFIQESSIKKEKIYYGTEEKLLTRGIIVLRVDRSRFDSILDGIKGLGLLLDLSIKSDDVTDRFYDVESELRLLKFEQQRLEQYLFKLTDPDTIFKTESRLTEIRHQIEGLTGTLNKLSDLVQLSTITVNLNEKGKDSAVPVIKNKTYWGKLGDGFTGSVKGVATFCGELLLLLVQAIPVLLLLTIFCAILWWLYRKFFRNKVIKHDKDNNNPM